MARMYRVATEGATTDGRIIERTWLEEIAKNYNPATFAARVWLEHIRGIVPDSAFQAYGDVTKVATQEIDGKLVLLAEINPLPPLLALNKARQKLFASLEIDPKFAKTGEAYLVGMGITDTPASLGLDMLAFSSKQGDKSPLQGRKQNPENLFTEGVEIELEPPNDTQGFADLLAKVKVMLSGHATQQNSNQGETAKAVLELAEHQKGLVEKYAALNATLDALASQVNANKAAHDALVTKLSQEPDDTRHKPPATGGDASMTDC
jgi:hypothetical protein